MLSLSTILGCVLANPAVLEFPLGRIDGETSDLTRRDVLDQSLYNVQYTYKIDFELGTPPQSMEIVLDTGSSDFYVLGPTVQACKSQTCQPGLVFDSSKSSTFHQNGTTFRTAYVDGSSANGTWVQDVLQIGSKRIENFNFAVASFSSSNQTVGGIGLANGEASYVFNKTTHPYSNLPLQLKENGIISHVAYSLWLNSMSTSAGSILFGGIDSTHVASDIYTFPLIKSLSGSIDAFSIKLDGLYLVARDGSQQKFADTSIPVVFDSGTVISRLPLGILEPFYDALGAIEYHDYYIVECSSLSKGGGVGLVFGGVEFVFSFHDIAIPIDTKGQYCVPGFLTNSVPLIGDNILRSLYVVYDLENLELGLALANTEASLATVSRSYVEISTGIPGTKAPGYSSTKALQRYKTYAVGSNAVSLASTDAGSTGISFATGISVTLGQATRKGIVTAYTSAHTVPAPTTGTESGTSTATSSGSANASSGKKNAAVSARVATWGLPMLAALGAMVALI